MSDSISIKPKRITVRRSKEEILAFLSAFDQVSDHVDPDEFCRDHGICPGTFYTWRRLESKNGKYSGAPKSYGKFLELISDSPVNTADQAISQIAPGSGLFASISMSGKTIHLHQSVPPEYIRLLLGLQR